MAIASVLEEGVRSLSLWASLGVKLILIVQTIIAAEKVLRLVSKSQRWALCLAWVIAIDIPCVYFLQWHRVSLILLVHACEKIKTCELCGVNWLHVFSVEQLIQRKTLLTVHRNSLHSAMCLVLLIWSVFRAIGLPSSIWASLFEPTSFASSLKQPTTTLDQTIGVRWQVKEIPKLSFGLGPILPLLPLMLLVSAVLPF